MHNLAINRPSRIRQPPSVCPYCNHPDFIRRGKDRGHQRYRCRQCYRHFTEDTTTFPKIIKENPLCPYCNQHTVKLGKTNGSQRYWCRYGCNRTFSPSTILKMAPDDRPEYDKDIWNVKNLGIEVSPVTGMQTLNFTSISQPWLHEAAKLYIKYTLATLSVAKSVERLSLLRQFSVFLSKFYPSLKPSEIDRSLVVEYLSYLAGFGSQPNTRVKHICSLKTFFELCSRNQWADVPKETLIFREDYPRQKKSQPRYIPQEVIDQLNQHLDAFPPPLMRMVLVIQECGMRASELCLLSFNCLIQDTQGDWFVRYYQGKMKKEISIPISRELVAVIQEQQHYIRENLGPDYQYLFCKNQTGGGTKGGKLVDGHFAPVPQPPPLKRFPRALNLLAKEKNICDSTGQLWHFQTHQFRHTVATRMINLGVPVHIISRYLGHESPEMTIKTYAHIHDQKLKEEIAKFHSKIVDITGKVVESKDLELDSSDLQWFKRNVQAQALPNGSCALPTIAQGCPHANACLTCTHFRTTSEFIAHHKEQLEQTEKIIEKARANGWLRQIEMNEKVATNLRNVIKTLEKQDASA